MTTCSTDQLDRSLYLDRVATARREWTYPRTLSLSEIIHAKRGFVVPTLMLESC